jgi:hypothetical protein
MLEYFIDILWAASLLEVLYVHLYMYFRGISEGVTYYGVMDATSVLQFDNESDVRH